MEHETKELFNAIINEMDRMQERIYNKIDSSIDAFKEEIRQQPEWKGGYGMRGIWSGGGGPLQSGRNSSKDCKRSSCGHGSGEI